MEGSVGQLLLVRVKREGKLQERGTLGIMATFSRSKEANSLVNATFEPSISSWRSLVEHVVV